MQKWKQIAGLATLLIGLGALATWDEWKTKNEEKEKETKGILLPIKPESIVGLRIRATTEEDGGAKTAGSAISSAGATDVTLKNTDGTWAISVPVTTTADQQVVTDLIKNLTDYKTESEVSTSKDQWPQFGLDKPRRDIEIETKDGKKLSFYVGLNTPVGFSAYVATSDSPKAFAGSQYIVTSTGKSLFDLRDKKILSGSASTVTGLTVTAKNNQGTETLALSQADGKWLIQRPVSAPGDSVSVKNYLDDLFGLKATEFIDSPNQALLAAMSDKNLLAKIDLTQSPGSHQLTFYQTKDGIYARAVNTLTIFKLADDARGKIVKTAKDLRDKKIFSFGSADVSKVTIDGEAFAKVATDWYRAEDAGKFAADGKFTGKAEEKPSGASHVRGLVVDLEYARAEDVYDAASDVAKNLPKAPKHRVVLGLTPKEPDITIDVWTAQDNPEMIYIRRTGASQIFKSKRSTIASLTPSKIAPAGDEATMNPLQSMPPEEPTK
jgi:hypothetical protein